MFPGSKNEGLGVIRQGKKKSPCEVCCCSCWEQWGAPSHWNFLMPPKLVQPQDGSIRSYSRLLPLVAEGWHRHKHFLHSGQGCIKINRLMLHMVRRTRVAGTAPSRDCKHPWGHWLASLDLLRTVLHRCAWNWRWALGVRQKQQACIHWVLILKGPVLALKEVTLQKN